MSTPLQADIASYHTADAEQCVDSINNIYTVSQKRDTILLFTVSTNIKFLAESDGERILKIGQYLPKLWTRVYSVSFF